VTVLKTKIYLPKTDERTATKIHKTFIVTSNNDSVYYFNY